MKITKRKRKTPRHYEFCVTSNVAEIKAFSAYIIQNGFNKNKRTLRFFINCFAALIILFLVRIFVFFIAAMNLNTVVEYISYVVEVIGFTNLYLIIYRWINRKNYKFKESDVEAVIAHNQKCETTECEYVTEYSLGEKGMTFNNRAANSFGVCRYKNAKAVIECELGIIIIFSEDIFCIPARYFNDESACVITQILRKKCRGVYKTMGLMKISRDNTTERNENK